MADDAAGRASRPTSSSSRSLTIDFDANVGPGISWRFEPVQRQQQLKIGETGARLLPGHQPLEPRRRSAWRCST